jgi:hypothetical protein
MSAVTLLVLGFLVSDLRFGRRAPTRQPSYAASGVCGLKLMSKSASSAVASRASSGTVGVAPPDSRRDNCGWVIRARSASSACVSPSSVRRSWTVCPSSNTPELPRTPRRVRRPSPAQPQRPRSGMVSRPWAFVILGTPNLLRAIGVPLAPPDRDTRSAVLRLAIVVLDVFPDRLGTASAMALSAADVACW